MAGYSGTPLLRKLGIEAGHRVALVDAPPAFALRDLPEGVDVIRDLPDEADVILFFAVDLDALLTRLPALQGALHQAGGLWIAWPKKASGIVTDLSDGVVRRVGLETGLVDNKVCAVDETWSGLRFVVRLVNRR